jgi:Gpi18-like mannosyltransferase
MTLLLLFELSFVVVVVIVVENLIELNCSSIVRKSTSREPFAERNASLAAIIGQKKTRTTQSNETSSELEYYGSSSVAS